MKKILILFFFLGFWNQMIACECANENLINTISRADFIGKVKVLEITRDSIDNEYLNLKIELIELYKGKYTSTLKILTNDSMCNAYTPAGTTWLIYATSDRNGKISFQYCSGSKQLDKEFDSVKYPKAESSYRNSLNLALNLLRSIKDKNISTINEYDIRAQIKSNCYTGTAIYEKEQREFALYELKINKDLSIRKAKILKEFEGVDSTRKIAKCVKNNLRINKSNKLTKIKKPTKVILALYYYPSEKGNPRLISSRHL